jgi:hypothetical protein
MCGCHVHYTCPDVGVALYSFFVHSPLLDWHILGASVTWYPNRSYCAPIVHIWATTLITVGLFVPMPVLRT